MSEKKNFSGLKQKYNNSSGNNLYANFSRRWRCLVNFLFEIQQMILEFLEALFEIFMSVSVVNYQKNFFVGFVGWRSLLCKRIVTFKTIKKSTFAFTHHRVSPKSVFSISQSAIKSIFGAQISINSLTQPILVKTKIVIYSS